MKGECWIILVLLEQKREASSGPVAGHLPGMHEVLGSIPGDEELQRVQWRMLPVVLEAKLSVMHTLAKDSWQHCRDKQAVRGNTVPLTPSLVD